MKNILKRASSLLLALAVLSGLFASAFAADSSPFAPDAYSSVVTASDFQHSGTEAYDRYAKLLNMAKNDGLTKADSMLVGGDYTMLLFDNAVPGISRIRHAFLDAYPDADPESVVCIQGNHDNSKAEFAETGFYDMGSYCLYAINEDSFPWKQSSKKDDGVKAVAADIEKNLDKMITDGDPRPVIVITHVPLHHTGRNGYGDNMYASYIFNVLNEKAKSLDIIFLFGHNHSSAYDDYIGGSVNFMAPGDTIRIPLPDKTGEKCYTEETLRFTYANCGYIGYSDNNVTETSTNILTMGIIQFTPDTIRFIKYCDDGVYSVNDVKKINVNTFVNTPAYPAVDDTCPCHSDNALVSFFWNIYMVFAKLFGLSPYCACGECHY